MRSRLVFGDVSSGVGCLQKSSTKEAADEFSDEESVDIAAAITAATIKPRIPRGNSVPMK